MVKVEPVYSSGLSFLLSRPIGQLLDLGGEIVGDGLRSALRTTGVIRPSGSATATPMCTSPWVDRFGLARAQEALTWGSGGGPGAGLHDEVVVRRS